ncbi:hypothetical protein A2164_01670 [Candidatus Curtissbacteria bacterium RBG_13_35_7]|uniref:Uncharacterized protein n=1 Tax=Candidatus Curtissbacteria bacterium RBG_13_35_7 TaxID=1797705 RepID=A0A1F5G014_9BACT|nr:MAG: hypothetical protein A2164_01670 [Candidatus Curtissbacteria bacterium RBG_13_35_7]
MNYYHNLITDKSWKLLQKLRKRYSFILIGGWAVYLYTHSLKSKDIDLVLEFEELDRFKDEFMVSKNNRLKKYEVKTEEVDIDIYVPFYSNPGIPAEELKGFTTNVEGFQIIIKEVLAILKQRALLDRVDSVKGRKDLIDLASIFMLADFDWRKYQKMIRNYRLGEFSAVTKKSFKQISSIDELDLNNQKMARFKKKVLSLI